MTPSWWVHCGPRQCPRRRRARCEFARQRGARRRSGAIPRRALLALLREDDAPLCYTGSMPVDDDYAREERIKRLRRLVSAGQAHMLYLHEAVPTYLRLSEMSAARNSLARPKAHREDQEGRSPKLQRELAVSTGRLIAEVHHRSYSKIYRWLTDADNGAPRNLSDPLVVRYAQLPPAFQIPDGSKRSTERQIELLAQLIEKRLVVFGAQLRLDGEYEDVTPAIRDAPGGWPHLRGVLTDAVLDGYLRQMSKRRTKSEMGAAIGAAKEVVEATMKALAARHCVAPDSKKPDLQDWWKVLRRELADARLDAALGSADGALLKLISAEVSLVQSLGELRNKVGTGHGKAAHPAGLTSAHALLAVDTAHTVTRFLTS